MLTAADFAQPRNLRFLPIAQDPTNGAKVRHSVTRRGAHACLPACGIS